jgi:hypothetical protein
MFIGASLDQFTAEVSSAVESVEKKKNLRVECLISNSESLHWEKEQSRKMHRLKKVQKVGEREHFPCCH